MKQAAPASAGRAGVFGALLLVLSITAATVAALRWPAGALPPEPTPSGQAELQAMLQRHLERYPRDGRGWALLAFREVEAERWPQAAAAFEKALASSRKVAADAGMWCEYADALGMAQGGSLQGRPTELIERALALKSSHPKALEMAGSAAYERRDFRSAVAYWQRLLPQLAVGSQPHAELDAAIQRAQRLAASSLPPPPR